jgi:hypothetical protein
LYKGITLEPASTNIILNSQTFSGYSLTNMTILNNANIAPDGSNTASQVSATTAAACRMFNQYPSSPTQNPSTFTQSVYAKAGTYGYINLMPFAAAGTGYSATFNLNDGTYRISGNGDVSASMTPVGNGWYRCVIICSKIYYWTPFGLSLTSYSGNSDAGWTTLYPAAGQYVFLWGAQSEVLPTATSYIPTTTVAVTRAADISTSTAQTRAADVYSSSQVTRAVDAASMPVIGWYNTQQGTQYIESQNQHNALAHAGMGAAIYTAYRNNTFHLNSHRDNASSPAGQIVSYVPTGSLTVWSSGPVNSFTDPNAFYKSAGSISSTSVAIAYMNNTPVTQAGSYSVPNPTTLGFNLDVYSYSPFSGHIKKFAYYPKQLSNNELVGLTT